MFLKAIKIVTKRSFKTQSNEQFQYISHSRFSLGFPLSASYGTGKVTGLTAAGHLH